MDNVLYSIGPAGRDNPGLRLLTCQDVSDSSPGVCPITYASNIFPQMKSLDHLSDCYELFVFTYIYNILVFCSVFA